MAGRRVAASTESRKERSGHVALLDRSLEELPLFRLSDAAEEGALAYTNESGGRWRVLPAPGERLPGTFDQDVYVELMHRFHEAGAPRDGAVTFTLHAFLRSMGRQVDGRTYGQLRAALARLERTELESFGSYVDAQVGHAVDLRFTVLSAVAVERRRAAERDQLGLFPVLVDGEPGEARVVISAPIRRNLEQGGLSRLPMGPYLSLASPVARRLYRLIQLAVTNGLTAWRVAEPRLAEQLPLSQRYPSHLQRVLQPANDALKSAGVIQDAIRHQHLGVWYVDYVIGSNRAFNG